MSHLLASAPTNAVVGRGRIAARERGPARHRRTRSTPTTWSCRTKDVLHAHPVQAPHAHARITALRPEPAYDVPGVVRVLTAADVPGVNDAGVKHDEPLFPDEVMFHGHAVCWVLGETLEAARRGAAAVEVDYEPLPALLTVERGDRGRELPGRPAAPWRAATSTPGWRGAAHVFEGEIEFAGQEHFYLETHCALAHGRRGRPGLRAVQHPAPDRDPGDRRPRARRAQPRGHRAVPADGRRVRRQGDAAARLRRGRRARRDPDRPSGPAAADPHAGHDDDRQAARLPRRRGGSASTTTGGFTALDATLTSDGGWSLDLSEPVLARALCHVDNAYWIPDVARARPDRARPTRPRRPRSAASAARRGCS